MIDGGQWALLMVLVSEQNKLTMFGAHCPFNPLYELGESKVNNQSQKTILEAMANMDDRLYDEMQNFLVKARTESFAGNGKFLQKSNRSKQYRSAHGKWRYRDEYFGSFIDIWMEIVYYEKTPVWGMNYFGGIKPSEFLDKKVVFSFLREALSNVDVTYPFRGPEFFKNQFGSYHCIVMGDIRFFSGRENIQVCEKIVYEKQFCGGAILY